MPYGSSKTTEEVNFKRECKTVQDGVLYDFISEILCYSAPVDVNMHGIGSTTVSVHIIRMNGTYIRNQFECTNPNKVELEGTVKIKGWLD